MVIRLKFIVTITFVLVFLQGKSQINLSLYPLDNHFNSSNYNPAYLSSKQKFTFSVFPMGGTNIGYNNQKVIKDLISNVLKGEISDDNYRDILRSMIDRSLIHQNIESTLLTFTYRTKLGFLNLRIKENETFLASAKGELSSFLLNDEVSQVTVGKSQKLHAQLFHDREYSIGYSFKSPLNRFYGGIRAKLYFGKAAMYSDIEGIILKNSTNNYQLTTNGNVHISFPEATYSSESGAPKLTGQTKITNYLLNAGNPGLGLDLGFRFRVTPNLSLSMSLIDLGKINWRSHLNARYLKPYDISDSIITNISAGDKFETITKSDYPISDDLPAYVEEEPNKIPFTRSLPMSVFMSINYQLKRDLAINLVGRKLSSGDLNIMSLMASATFSLNNGLTLNTGYSIVGNSLFNLPFALLYSGSFGQIYLSSDNMASLFFPSLSEYAGISFGTCFYLFRQRNLYDRPTERLPFHKPKKKWGKQTNGLIRKAFPED